MARSVNQVFLIGRLTRDAEVKQTTTGKNVASFSIALDKRTGEGVSYIDCVAWEKTAELVSQYTQKGSKVHVQGYLDQRSWEQDGQKRSKIEVIVTDVTFLDAAPAGGSQRVDSVGPVTNDAINLNDIPF